MRNVYFELPTSLWDQILPNNLFWQAEKLQATPIKIILSLLIIFDA